MKIRVQDIRDSLSVEIKGNEPWLTPFYESFAQRSDGSPGDKSGKLVANVRIDEIPGDVIRVSGNVKFSPLISCGRCGDAIIWPVDRSFDVYYERDFPFDPEQREINLRPGELDRYYVENGMIDLEALLNEMVQLDIPLSNIRASEDESKCLVCDEDLTVPLAYEEMGEMKKESPFAVLGSKNLKH